jgi:protein-tyrosine phosphatase
MGKFKFAPASRAEQTVFGAERPGYPARSVGVAGVQEWISFMRARGIQRVCCLLSPDQLAYYAVDLLQAYREAFGEDKVCWAPVKDYHLIQEKALAETVLPFLRRSDAQGEPVVVHCSGGIGRTGYVLAAWLARGRGLGIQDALSSVQETGRNPYEAVEYGHASDDDLMALLGGSECPQPR